MTKRMHDIGKANLLSSTALTKHMAAFGALGLFLGATPAHALDPNALPQDPNVAGGAATFNQSGSTLTVNQSTNRTVIDWRSFDIGSSATTTFVQPGSSSIAVNRVNSSANPTEIQGTLNANGQVWILNPNGVMFGKNAKIDVAGIVASTGNVDAGAFMRGDNQLQFSGADAGSVVNEGTISVADGGLAAFVAPSVRNSGVIRARVGKVELAAGTTFTLDLAGDQLVELGLGSNNALVDQSGQIVAEGSTISISARSASALVDSVINVSGTVLASSVHADGGKIVLTADNITTTSDANLAADGGDNGNGGSIYAYADKVGSFDGSFSAQGGENGGNGGSVETSGKNVQIADGIAVSTQAANGETGSWTIDPDDLVVGSGGTMSAATVVAGLAANNVNLEANNSITVNDAIVSTETGASKGSLALNDQDSNSDLTINLNAKITLGAGKTLTGQGTQVNVGSDGSIQNGVDVASTGANVDVAAGTFAGNVYINKGLTLAGAGMDATTLTDGIDLGNTSFSDLVFRDFTVSGASSNAVVKNGKVTNFTMDGVRVDGENVADQHGFASGKFYGDIAITNSEFVNIRGWSAFDNSTGGSATALTSVDFSNNLLDNVQGHIAFRQLNPTDVNISGNTVRNTGDATNSFGGIFKVFNSSLGGTVDFANNDVSDIGTSGFNPAGEAAYGAALLVRNVSDLNITGNTFTDNNQVFAVEPGKALPTNTTFTDNTFTNNAYVIYTPTNVLPGGSIVFDGTNNIISGADTVQSIVWRAAAGLDVTNVQFNGELGSEMSQAELFDLEDQITHGSDSDAAGLVTVKADNVFVTQDSGSIARGISKASAGNTVNVDEGSFALGTGQLNINKSLNLLGAGEGVTNISTTSAGYGIAVTGNDVSLSGFTFNANPNGTYAIKVYPKTGVSTDRVTNFDISDVTINGSKKTGLDFNAAVGVTIDNVTVTNTTNGNGIAFTDSADVTVTNTTTSNNAWGGLALYQTNRYYDQQVDNISIDLSNSFGEANPVYLEDESDGSTAFGGANGLDFGTLDIQGFDYAAHNTDASDFYTWLQTTVEGAANLLQARAELATGYVTGWTGSDSNNQLFVGHTTDNTAMSIAAAVSAAEAGSTVNVGEGDFALGTSQLNVNKSLTLDGAGEGVTNISTTSAGYGINVTGNSVSLSDFTFNGNPSGSYGIKVAPTGAATNRLTDFAISNVTVDSSYRTGLDLNGVNGATIDNVNVTGVAWGNGISLTDSANVTVTNSTTSGNAWGGLAIYQANRSYDQQVDNISIDATNSFAEANPVYMQDESASQDIGSVNIAGFAYAGHNDNPADKYTFLNNSVTGLADWLQVKAQLVGGYVTGWTGSAANNTFYVGHTTDNTAMSIAAAVNHAADNATINVGSGTFASFATSFGGASDLLIQSVDGAVIDGSTRPGNNRIVDLRADGTTFTGFTINNGGGNGVGVSISGQGVTVSSNDISDVLTGVQTTSQNAAGNADISGNTINADYGISLQNTGNTVTNNDVTASVEGVGLSQGANTFSGNTFDLGASGNALALYGTASSNDMTTSGNTVNISGGSLQGAVDLTGAGGELNVNGGTFNEDVVVSGASRDIIFDGTTVDSFTTNVATAIGGTVSAVNGFFLNALTNLVSDTTLDGAVTAQSIAGAGNDLNVEGGATVLNGSSYVAASLNFEGSSTTLSAANTTFDTSASNGDITFTGPIFGTVTDAQNVDFNAGAGDISLQNAGTNVVWLGNMSATGHDFSADTVYVNSFNSVLTGNQTFSSDTLNTKGAVTSTVGGNATGPINAGGNVNVNAGGAFNGNVNAPTTTVTGNTIAGTFTGTTANLNAGSSVNVNTNVTNLNVNAPSGSVSGSYTNLGNTGGPLVINGKTVQGNASTNPNQIVVEGFTLPAGAIVTSSGEILLPSGIMVGLVSPAAGPGAEGGKPKVIIVHNVRTLGELLAQGYVAIVVDLNNELDEDQEIAMN